MLDKFIKKTNALLNFNPSKTSSENKEPITLDISKFIEHSALWKEHTKPLEISRSDVVLADPGNNIFDQLPDEIKLLILSYLTAKELCRSASVSKHWNTLTSVNFLWKQFPTSNSVHSAFFKTFKHEYKENYLLSMTIKKKFTLNMSELTDRLPKIVYLETILQYLNSHLKILSLTFINLDK